MNQISRQRPASRGFEASRGLIVWFAVFSLTLLGVACNRDQQEIPQTAPSSTVSQASIPENLNVILITIDTLRTDRISCYGSQVVDTPALDAFAEEGIRFSNAASTVPFTLPAHTSILT